MQTVCEAATLTDPIFLTKSRFASSFPRWRVLNFTVFYDVYDLQLVLPYRQQAQQFACLLPAYMDAAPFEVLREYMARKEPVRVHLSPVIVPTLHDDERIWTQ